MCVGMNGDLLEPGERSASTSNRNFRGRQGVGSRTHLVSPAMAAAAAVTGTFTDVRTFKGIGIPIDIINCDTDQIIPARFLRKDRKDPEMHTFLWHDLRKTPAFIFNKAPYNEGKVVVADVNWGCGSSREGAVYALNANGIRAVVAPSFGDIHYNN